MEHRVLGRSGLLVSTISLGAMNFGSRTDDPTAEAMVMTALDAGVNLIDTADVYTAGQSERVVGAVLSASGRRDEVLVATKFGLQSGPGPNDVGATRRHIIRSCETSLRNLKTDRIDLYQLHRPYFDTAPEETLRALDDLVAAGKVVAIGSSTHPAWYLLECLEASRTHGWARFTSDQSPYNIVDRAVERELVPCAVRHGVGLLVWSPMAAGILAGRYPSTSEMPEGSRAARLDALRRRVTPAALEAADRLVDLAAAHSMTAAQLAVHWVIHQRGVTSAIVGPRTMEQLEEVLAIADRPQPSAELMELIDEIVAPGATVADFHNSSGWTPGSARPLSNRPLSPPASGR
jgi:aryl-alcohol dehydrogenase-like predicted oxidoreductase